MKEKLVKRESRVFKDAERSESFPVSRERKSEREKGGREERGGWGSGFRKFIMENEKRGKVQ